MKLLSSWPIYKEGGGRSWPVSHRLPPPGLIDYISIPEVQVNGFLHLVILYNTDAVPIYSEKAAWAAKEIATVLL